MELLYKINQYLSSLKEEKENNPLAQQVEKDTQYWIKQGLEKKNRQERGQPIGFLVQNRGLMGLDYKDLSKPRIGIVMKI